MYIGQSAEWRYQELLIHVVEKQLSESPILKMLFILNERIC